jgi:RNA-directed DNA polymerase
MSLERVRQAARQRKKERFTALLHHISIDCLRMAFFALKRDAASGVDGLTWPTYEADLMKLERFPLDMGHYAYPACRK